MKKSFRMKRGTALLVIIAMMAVSLIGCASSTSNDLGFLDDKDIVGDISIDDGAEEDVYPETKEGYTATPRIKSINNIDPDTVIIAGTCEKNAEVSVSSTQIATVTTNAVGEYFVLELSMPDKNLLYLSLTGKVEGKEKSEPKAFTVGYVSTAEKRIDGNGVSVGQKSWLFKDVSIDNFSGKTLVTQSELSSFVSRVNTRISAISKTADTEYVFVLIPSTATVYSEYLPSTVKKETYLSLFEQVKTSLGKTQAKVIDMTEKLVAEKNGEKGIFYKTDSHLTEYGTYLVYSELMNYIAEKYPDAKPRELSEFTETKALGLGGDVIDYAELERDVFTEERTLYVPKFSLDIGASGEEGSIDETFNISSVQKYVSDNDFLFYAGDSADEKDAVGTNEASGFKTDRKTLPCAVFQRDDSVSGMYDVIAERFNNSYFYENNAFDYRYNIASSYSAEERSTLVDYVIVFVGEDSLQKLVSSFI